MRNVETEKAYQRYIVESLVSKQGYIERKAKHFDECFAIDSEVLWEFLNATQPETLQALERVHKERLREAIITGINSEIDKNGLLWVLKHGVEVSSHHLELMYTKPATTFNQSLNRKYAENRFTIMEEVYSSKGERVDLVVFLNGLAIFAFELKCNFRGQSVHDAMQQYRTTRNPKDRLFLFKSGVLVCFAMDLREVYMTTKLDGENTYFLPFNQGSGKGINAGAGNPPCEEDYSVHYMWDDILSKDTILDLISKYMFIKTEEKEGKSKPSQTVIFPRYHQLDAIRKVLASVYDNHTALNYLIQHSAGSGKTNTIAWLAYRLSTIHDEQNKPIFDNVIIMTDRVVVDRQLQKAIVGMEHKSGLIRVMDDTCSSTDLAIALNGNTKIIATTIQKFHYILDNVKGLKNKRFAVIIDEAHSSTSGKDMDAVNQSLGMGDEIFQDFEDKIVSEMARSHKQSNVSTFAFTATPKPTTIQLFGIENTHGQKEAFHVYSMKQAIEEGFILDVLQNYTTYKTFYQINKEIQDDPTMKTSSAKRQIARFVELHDTNIAQRIEVIVEHFRNCVKDELGGQAKAMVVTASRESAVKYYQALKDYCTRKGYTDIHALVAFSGKVTLKDTCEEYTESKLNGIAEEKLAKEFDKEGYQVLLVANKYQTGFDQPKLCAMYIMKRLKGVNAVQTLSRLNRIYPPFEKKTFILDFVNSYEDVVSAFEPYYTTTVLSNTVNPMSIYDLDLKIDGYAIIDPEDVHRINEILYKEKVLANDKHKISFCVDKSQQLIKRYSPDRQKQILTDLRHFVRFYEFMVQATCFEDIELHKRYNYIVLLRAYISISYAGGGYDLNGKLRATKFVQKKTAEHAKSEIVANPVISLPSVESLGLTPDKVEKLSKIIESINARTGKTYNHDVAVKAMLQIKDILMQSEKLKASAKSNTVKDFEFAYFDDIDDALIEGLEQNQDFFSLLLNDEKIKREVLGIFTEEIYNSLKK